MNPLTLVKRLQNITAKEADLGISEEASWHAKYKDSAYIFVGGLPYDLTEGDLLAVFAQYGEVVDVNLVRDKGTGKSKGFAFLAYEDQRSTILAVDNLNGAQILGRIIRVDHAEKYKKKEEEDEEEEQKKREARGVCYAFQRGECTRGAGCKFSHDEQRAANTGWGHQDKSSRWGNDKFEGSKKSEKSFGVQERAVQEGFRSARGDEKASEKSGGREGKRSRSMMVKMWGQCQEKIITVVKIGDQGGIMMMICTKGKIKDLEGTMMATMSQGLWKIVIGRMKRVQEGMVMTGKKKIGGMEVDQKGMVMMSLSHNPMEIMTGEEKMDSQGMNQNLIQEKIMIREVMRNGQAITGIHPPIDMERDLIMKIMPDR
ncbi:RNA-binding motif protein, X-linked 2 [Hibiscus syriacus]|uniref:RNA-binding motif protein, X-linked 2 n=1 Tax=Hibiscus syriacus TaxID=106335 RepID=A0A6A2WR36_HIBSY|nr:RNA-binding motif protein, X-linked 2 [Hibiscus syriacus]